MEETGESTDSQIPHLSVDGFCEETGRFKNFACVTGMDIPFYHSVTSVH